MAFRPTLPQEPGLADELAGLVRSGCDEHRHRVARSQVDRAYRACAHRIEPEVCIERNLNQRLEIEHAADRHRAREPEGRSADVPVRCDQHRCEVPTRRMPGYNESLCRNAVPRALAL